MTFPLGIGILVPFIFYDIIIILRVLQFNIEDFHTVAATRLLARSTCRVCPCSPVGKTSPPNQEHIYDPVKGTAPTRGSEATY